MPVTYDELLGQRLSDAFSKPIEYTRELCKAIQEIQKQMPQGKTDVVAPDAHDDRNMGFEVGSRWYDIVHSEEYVCMSDAPGNARWDKTTTAGEETDPVFCAHVAHGITSQLIGQWSDAFGWGDHSEAGYLTAETDPVFGASPAAGIQSSDITNWNGKFDPATTWKDSWGAQIDLPVANDEWIIEEYAVFAFDVDLLAIRSATLAGHFKLQINNGSGWVDVTGIENAAVSATRNVANATAARHVALGGSLKLVCIDTTGATKVSYTVGYTRTL